MTALLASVRSLAEARLVAAGGADWIDLKEPAAGALGAVEAATVSAVAGEFAATHRLSATIGDCWETPEVIPGRVAAMVEAGAGYVKVGAYARAPGAALLDALRAACALPARVIVVCFAERPPVETDLRRLAATGIVGVMLDTADKHGASLCELLPASTLDDFVALARALGLLSGLAGRLRVTDIPALLPAGADYLGFRSALCADGARNGQIDPSAVATLRQRITGRVPQMTTKESSHGLA